MNLVSSGNAPYSVQVYQQIDANGDVSNTIEVWTIEDGKITSTGRFESP